MQSYGFFGNFATFQVAISITGILRRLLERSRHKKIQCYCTREWSFSTEVMECNAGSSHSNEKRPLECLKPDNERKKPTEKDMSTSIFVNHAAITWHESRRKWVGEQSQQSERMAKDPIISWSTTYEDLLSTNDPFPERIPLSEMVDFLVDIWHDEGLFD